MSELYGADLVDAITEWVDRADEDLDEHDIDAILRIQLAIDASRWSGVDAAELTQGDVASLKHHLSEIDAPEFTSWVIRETLASADIVPPRGPARKAPSSRRRTQKKKSKTDETTVAADGDTESSKADGDSGTTDADADGDGDARAESESESDASKAAESETDGDEPVGSADDEDGDALVDEDEDDLFEAESDDADRDESDELVDEAEPSDIDEPDLDEPDLDEPDLDEIDDGEPEAGEADLGDDDEDGESEASEAEASDEVDGDESDGDEPEEGETEPDDGGGIFASAVAGGATGGIFASTALDGGDASGDAPATDDDDPGRSAGFFAELERDTTTSVTGPAPIELRDAPDSLGPSFLPPSESTEGRGRRIGVMALAAVAIVAFVLAGIQLVNNVNQPDEEDVAVDADADDTDADDDATTSAADDDSTDDDRSDADRDRDRDDDRGGDDDDDDDDRGAANNGGDQDDEDDELTPEEAAALLLATPEPTPEADLPPAERTAIVLTEAGDIWSIDLFADGFGDPRIVHDSDEHAPATDVSLVTAGLGIVDDDGDVHITSRANPEERVRIWRSDRMGDARTVVQGSGQYAVLDTTGSVSLFDANRAATRLSADKIWDTSEGGTPPARDIDNYVDLIAFAVGNGDVQLVQTSDDDNPIFRIWDGETQPRAFNVNIGEDGLYIGVGAGAVARYQWFEDGPPLSAVWDPSGGVRLPAISYAPIQDRTAIVLNNGSVAAIDEAGDGPIMWDAEVSDLRAVSVTTLGDEVLLLLDGGTVLRVAGDGETQNRGSIWDVTDESTSPAIKILITDP